MHGAARGPAHPRLRARPHRPRRCWPRSRTSAPTASAASTRWPTACASSASSSTTRAPRTRRARPPAPRRRAARAPGQRERLRDEGIDGKNALFPAYLVPGAPGYVAPLAPDGAGGDRRHPRRRRPRRLGAPVLGPRRAAAPTLHEFAGYGIDGVEAFYATHTEEQTRALHAAARERGPADHRLDRLPRARRTSTSIASAAFELYGLEPDLGRIATSSRERLLEPVRERLAGQLLADVEDQARARVVDQLLRLAQRLRVAAGVLARARPARSVWNASSGAPAATHARSRYHRPASWSAWSSACVAARRSARRARSVNSVSRRLCSFLGRYWSSSSSARLDLLAWPLRRAARARSSTACHGRSVPVVPVQRRAGERLGRGAQRRPVAERERERLARRRRGSAAPPPRRSRAARRCDCSRCASCPGRRRVEAHRLAAAGDRRQHLRQAGR